MPGKIESSPMKESMDEGDDKMPASEPMKEPRSEKRIKGTATCTHCGNEADMWIDL